MLQVCLWPGVFGCAALAARVGRGEICFDPVGDDALHKVVDGHGARTGEQLPFRQDAVPHQLTIEGDILVAAGSIFRQRQIVRVEAQSARPAGIGVGQTYQTLLLAVGQGCGLR